jgi:hypothetical protein
VYRHEVTPPKDLSGRWYFVLPKTELGVIENAAPWCAAVEPLSAEPHERWYWRRPTGIDLLTIETSAPLQWKFSSNGKSLAVSTDADKLKNRLAVALGDLPEHATIVIENGGERRAWFRTVDLAANDVWMTPQGYESSPPTLPFLADAVFVARQPSIEPSQTFVTGRFGQGLLLVPGRELHIPDEIVVNGEPRRLSDQRQGTIEFWIRRIWDERVAAAPASIQLLNAGSLVASCPTPNLKLNDWTHVAIVWRPMPGADGDAAEGGEKSLVHAYFDGVDYAFYRSLAWEGYSKPTMFDPSKPWLKEFVTKGYPNALFAIDDVRISNEPRYVNLKLDFGRQQTFNPDAFAPPDQPAEHDAATVVLLPLDGDMRGTTVGGGAFESKLMLEKWPAP